MKRNPYAMRSMLAAAATSLLLLGACSGGDDEASQTAQGENGGGGGGNQGEDDAASTSRQVGEVQRAPKLDDAVGARREARFEDCSVKAGEVTVPGQVTNNQKKAQDYAVSVSWIVEGSQVVARGVAKVTDVPPGETEQFEVTTELRSDAKDCTFNVRRAASEED